MTEHNYTKDDIVNWILHNSYPPEDVDIMDDDDISCGTDHLDWLFIQQAMPEIDADSMLNYAEFEDAYKEGSTDTIVPHVFLARLQMKIQLRLLMLEIEEPDKADLDYHIARLWHRKLLDKYYALQNNETICQHTWLH